MVELENGIRVVHRHVSHIKIAHVGVMLDIGSRDENPEEQGIAHFWEHMAFKGTKRRKAFHIINRLESLGGELNAYTTKEKICFYSAILSNHLEKALDVLSDITFNSTFPQKQIENERKVILEEMAMYKDNPEDSLFDEFDELVFRGHALGMNILGSEKTVSSFHQEDFFRFINRNLNTKKIIVSSVGNYPFEKLLKLVRKHFQSIPFKNHTPKRIEFANYAPQNKVHERHLIQAHHILGCPSYKLEDPNRIPFFMLTNILGGPALNSRLNMSLREKHGYVYGVEAHFAPYTDSGLFNISFASDPKNVDKCINLVKKEIKNLQTRKLGNVQLNQAKQQLKGQLAMSEENNNALMLMMAKSLLDLNRIPSLDRIFIKIDQITADQLVEIANEALDEDKMSSLTFLPK